MFDFNTPMELVVACEHCGTFHDHMDIKALKIVFGQRYPDFEYCKPTYAKRVIKMGSKTFGRLTNAIVIHIEHFLKQNMAT